MYNFVTGKCIKCLSVTHPAIFGIVPKLNLTGTAIFVIRTSNLEHTVFELMAFERFQEGNN